MKIVLVIYLWKDSGCIQICTYMIDTGGKGHVKVILNFLCLIHANRE